MICTEEGEVKGFSITDEERANAMAVDDKQEKKQTEVINKEIQ